MTSDTQVESPGVDQHDDIRLLRRDLRRDRREVGDLRREYRRIHRLDTGCLEDLLRRWKLRLGEWIVRGGVGRGLRALARRKRRHPLHIMLLRVHRIPRPVTVRVRDEYHGCRSWVEIDRDLPFEGTPVMADEEFDRAREEIKEVCGAAEPALV